MGSKFTSHISYRFIIQLLIQTTDAYEINTTLDEAFLWFYPTMQAGRQIESSLKVENDILVIIHFIGWNILNLRHLGCGWKIKRFGFAPNFDFSFSSLFLKKQLTLMNPLRSTITKNVTSRLSTRTLLASGSVLGATSRVGGARASIMQSRGYSSENPKKGGSGGLVFLSKSNFIFNQNLKFSYLFFCSFSCSWRRCWLLLQLHPIVQD